MLSGSPWSSHSLISEKYRITATLYIIEKGDELTMLFVKKGLAKAIMEMQEHFREKSTVVWVFFH
jgi:hypothetical protein